MQFIIPGKPVPQKRARTFLRNNFIHHYNSQSKEVKELQNFIRELLNDQHSSYPVHVPLHLIIKFYMLIPKSLSHKGKARLEGTYHTKRPDLSNMQKYYEDAFNGILWDDDSSISKTSTEKIWSIEPKTILTVVPLEENVGTSQKNMC